MPNKIKIKTLKSLNSRIVAIKFYSKQDLNFRVLHRDRLHWMAERVLTVPQQASRRGAGEAAKAQSWRDHRLC